MKRFITRSLVLGSKFKLKLGHYMAWNLDLNARSSPTRLCQLPHCWVNVCYLRFKLLIGVWVTAGRVTIYPCCPLTGIVVLAVMFVCEREREIFFFFWNCFILSPQVLHSKVRCWLKISVVKKLVRSGIWMS